MVKQTVTNGCFVDMPRFWIENMKRLISSVFVGTMIKTFSELEDVINESQRKKCYVRFVAFSFHEFLPRLQKIFAGNNIFKCMAQLNLHTYKAPPQRNLPIVEKCVRAYALWHDFVRNFPKDSRYTLGKKIDDRFLDLMEILFRAGASHNDKEKLLEEASVTLDILKFLLRVSWEIKAMDNKKYILLSERLGEVGKMLGGWQKYFSKQTSAV